MSEGGDYDRRRMELGQNRLTCPAVLGKSGRSEDACLDSFKLEHFLEFPL